MMKKRVRMHAIETGGLLMAEANDTTEACEQWFKRKVEAGIKASDEGRVISHEALKEKWQAKSAAQLDRTG